MLREWISVIAGVDEKRPGGLAVIDGLIETALGSGRQAALDLDRPAVAIPQLQYQVDLGAAGRAV